MYRNILLLALLSLGSCEKDIKVKTPDYTPLLVINSATQNTDVIKADVSKSIGILNYNGQQSLMVPDAIVKLYMNGTYIETMQLDLDEMVYVSTTKPAVGNTYKIVANAGTFKEAEGTAEVPEFVPIIDVNHKIGAKNHQHGYMQDEIRIKFKDPATKGDYYLVEVIHPLTLDTTWTGGNPGQNMIGCINATDPSITTTSSFDFNSDDCIGTNNLYLSDELFNGNIKEFRFYLDTQWLIPFENSLGEKFYPQIKLHHISAEHFKHLKTHQYALDNEGNPFAEPVNVSTNIKNGYGIFAITSHDMYEVKQ